MSQQRGSQPRRSGLAGCFRLFQILFIIAILGSCVASQTGITSERPPYFPRTYYEDVSNVIIQDISIYSVKTVEGPVLKKGARIAVLNFRSPGESPGDLKFSTAI